MRSLIKEFNEKIAGRKEYWIPLLFYTFGAYGFSMLNRTVGADDLATPLYVNDTYWLRELRWGAVLWKKLFSFGACVPFLDKFLSVCLLMLAGTAFSCILFMINGKKDRPLLYTVAACSFITFPIICEIWEFTCGGTLIVPGDFFCTFVILLWLLSAQENLQPPEGKSSIARRIKSQRVLQSQARTCLLAGILLTPVISSAESIAPVYVTTVLIILFYRYCVRGTAPGRKTAWFFEGVRFAIPLVISFILRLVIGYGIMGVLHLTYQHTGATRISWPLSGQELMDLFKGVLIDYGVADHDFHCVYHSLRSQVHRSLCKKKEYTPRFSGDLHRPLPVSDHDHPRHCHVLPDRDHPYGLLRIRLLSGCGRLLQADRQRHPEQKPSAGRPWPLRPCPPALYHLAPDSPPAPFSGPQQPEV